MGPEPVRTIDLQLRVATLHDEIHLVAAKGEADLFSARTLWQTIENLFEDGVRTIVVDFGEVTFVDSTALGVLISATQLLGANGGHLYLTGGRGALQRAANMAGLDGFLEFRDSLSGIPVASK